MDSGIFPPLALRQDGLPQIIVVMYSAHNLINGLIHLWNEPHVYNNCLALKSLIIMTMLVLCCRLAKSLKYYNNIFT